MTKEYIELPKLSKDEIYLSDIKTLEIVLEEIKEVYRENEGKELLQEVISNENCPSALKEFVEKYQIFKIGFEKLIENEDYMPDYGKYITLEGISEKFGFLFECSECYEDINSCFDGVAFMGELSLLKSLKQTNSFSNIDSKEILNMWEYLLSFADVGHKRKLFCKN